jgi:ElaB/YqjD/DUF883 family membrane-anchored ribosome-binding protein
MTGLSGRRERSIGLRVIAGRIDPSRRETIMAVRRKQPGAKKLDARIDALRTDLDCLQSDIKALPADAQSAASEKLEGAMRLAESVAERALRLAEDTASQTYDDVGHWANDNLDSARDRVREQPLSALLVSLGIGAILGAVLLRI